MGTRALVTLQPLCGNTSCYAFASKHSSSREAPVPPLTGGSLASHMYKTNTGKRRVPCTRDAACSASAGPARQGHRGPGPVEEQPMQWTSAASRSSRRPPCAAAAAAQPLTGSSAASTARPSWARMLYVATALGVDAGSIATPRASSAARSAAGTCCMCLPQPSTSRSARDRRRLRGEHGGGRSSALVVVARAEGSAASAGQGRPGR